MIGCGKRFEYGVGYAKCGFLPDILCPECLAYFKGRKEALEDNLFGWKAFKNGVTYKEPSDQETINKHIEYINSELEKLNEVLK